MRLKIIYMKFCLKQNFLGEICVIASARKCKVRKNTKYRQAKRHENRYP